MTARSLHAVGAVVLLFSGTLLAAQNREFGRTQPPRDSPAQATGGEAEGTATISGRVVAADTGEPLKRARVTARVSDARGLIVSTTDAAGRYALVGLRAGRYTISVSRPGFVTLSYGQRRPRQPATPIQVLAGDDLHDVSFSLPRGSVITGQLVDEDGVALPLAAVRAMRYVYRQGQRQLVPVGEDRSDDRGQYRIFGLAPGNYYVSATAPGQLGPAAVGRFALRAGGPAGRFADPFEPPRADDDQGLGYAPTYYPGATGLGQALPVTLGLSTEMTGVDFGVLLVPTARVSGTVLRADAGHPGAARVVLVPEDGAFFRGATSGARVEDNGRFEIRHVPPGRYILRAVLRRASGGPRNSGRPRGRTPPMFASQALEIDGFDVTDLTLVLGPGARLSGSVDFDTTGSDPDDVTRIRVSATPLAPIPMVGGADARVQSDGTFELEGIADGARLLRASGAPSGWVLQAVYLDGRDVIDTPLDFGGVGHVEGVRLIFSDRVSELSGVVHDRRGEPLTDFTVIAFPPNEERWQPASRFIRASRPDQNGSYQITGLPAGDYLLAAVDVVEQGEWYDPRFLDPLRAGAVRLRLGAGEAKALDLTLGAQNQ